MASVLVTGGSGFVAAHCIVQLLQAGHDVRTTVRSPGRVEGVRAMVQTGGADPSRLAFQVVDLLDDAGWPDAMAGIEHVLHVASPFPVRQPKNPDELIRPARDGALRALRFARDAGALRVVLTSSFAAVGYTNSHPGVPFTEADWTDPDDPRISAYVRSKTIAERAAWDFVDREGGGLELAVVNPVGVMGPALGPDFSSSIALLQGLLDGRLPALPRIHASVVDVRDVASLHVSAMTHPDAAGERFLAVAGDPMSFPEMAALLRERVPQLARHAPRLVMPDWMVRLGARVNADLRGEAAQLVPKAVSHAKAERVLGWHPRSNEEALIATAESLQRLGLLRP